MASIRKRGLLADCTNDPIANNRSCAVKAREHQEVRQEDGPQWCEYASLSVLHQSTAEAGENASTRMGLRGDRDHSITFNLKRFLATRPEVLQLGQPKLHAYIERNCAFTVQKALALNIFSISVAEGGGILEACNLAAKFTGFSPQVIRRWAEAVFRDYFGATSSIDDIDDESLGAELMSSRGKHPKWVSLVHDEKFQLDATEYLREHSYVKRAPNLTLADFAQWVAETWHVEVCKETARLWLHRMGFSYRQFSKGVYFDGHEREDVVQHRKFSAAQDAYFTIRVSTYSSSNTASHHQNLSR